MNREQRLFTKRKYLIDKKFQFSFIFRNFIFLLVSFLLVFGIMLVWNVAKFRQGFLIQPPKNEQIEEWAKKNNVDPGSGEYAYQFILQAKTYTFFDITWKPLLVVFVLDALFLSLANVYYSHKIAGPIFRLKMYFEGLSRDKESKPLTFRKTDRYEYQQLAKTINKALENKNRK
jgi:hypothetical protein